MPSTCARRPSARKTTEPGRPAMRCWRYWCRGHRPSETPGRGAVAAARAARLHQPAPIAIERPARRGGPCRRRREAESSKRPHETQGIADTAQGSPARSPEAGGPEPAPRQRRGGSRSWRCRRRTRPESPVRPAPPSRDRIQRSASRGMRTSAQARRSRSPKASAAVTLHPAREAETASARVVTPATIRCRPLSAIGLEPSRRRAVAARDEMKMVEHRALRLPDPQAL